MPSPTAFVDLIGMAAGVLTTASFIPQVLKVSRTKSTGDLSLGMFLMFSVGVFLWLVFGILLGSLPIVLANLVTFLCALFILWNKLRYG